MSACQVCGGRGDMCPHCDGYGECRSACCKDPMEAFDPAICAGCYDGEKHGTAFHDKPPGHDALGMVLDCPECGVLTTGPHTEACSRSGVMLGERHHRQATE